jgi:hypothetical protein
MCCKAMPVHGKLENINVPIALRAFATSLLHLFGVSGIYIFPFPHFKAEIATYKNESLKRERFVQAILIANEIQIQTEITVIKNTSELLYRI